ncbi:MAG TPA: serine/threonine-protein kinase, partial [Gemmatales bacterium]|nr:serine/threonine-protein kinase [Gemmatales bacterium]
MPDTSAFNPMPPSPEPVPPASPEGAAPSLGEATVIRKPDAAPVHGDWSHLLRGQRLGQFVIEEPLGAGGMAAVLRARDTQLDRLVALKILPPDLARDPDNVRRFHNEARAAARLDSPYIARVYASGTDLDLHYIAYEFVEGESLRNRIERERKLPPAEVVRLGWQMAQALAHAVERGVVHRDVKPANIVMGVRGEAKLVDMGLARAQVEANQAELTQSGVTLGTFDYLAPEQALDPRQADVRSDIYSLGCTLYHAITGQPPVPGGTAARKLQAHQQELPLDPRQLNASVGDGLAALLARMMAKDPALRFSSPAELAQHFRMLMPPEATGATPLPELERQLLAALQPPRRSDAVWPLVGAAVLLLALTFVILPWLPGLGPGMPWAPDPPRLAQASPPLPPLSPVPTTTPEISPGPTLPASPAEPALPMVREVTTGSDLRTALEQRAQGVLTLAGDGFELNLGESEPLVLAQCDWTLQAPPGKRPVLRLVLRSTAWLGSDGRLQPGLTVRRGRLVLRGLRVEVVAPPDAPDWTAFHAHGGVLQFVDCELVTLPTHRLAPMDGWVTLVQATTDRSLPLPFVATVDVQQSLLYGGVEGFWMDAGTQLTLRDCVVGPFERTIRIRQTEATAGRPNTVEMTRVTWLLGAGPGLVADVKLPLRWRLTESVMGGPPRDGEAPGPPLLLVGADQLRLVEWRSQANSFHQLDALIAQGQGEDRARVVAATVQNLSAAPPGIQDDDSRQDRVLPFAHDQVWDQLRRLGPAPALEALRLNPKLA